MNNKNICNTVIRRPEWIRGRISLDENSRKVRDLLKELNLNSVCVDAACPNRGECWGKRHVTFMILGRNCTRRCSFCNVSGESPERLDAAEPAKIARAINDLGLKYVVITSVTRDDLPDKGTGQFVSTVKEIKTKDPGVLVELLIPDMDADPDLLRETAFSGAEVVGHNIEMPESLYPEIRPKADYRRSLRTLALLKEQNPDIAVKSAIIAGLGETKNEISRTIEDLRDAGVDILYIGQYLSPSGAHWPVKNYYTPGEFRAFEEEARRRGFKTVCSGPMVRSSFRAYETYIAYKSMPL